MIDWLILFCLYEYTTGWPNIEWRLTDSRYTSIRVNGRRWHRGNRTSPHCVTKEGETLALPVSGGQHHEIWNSQILYLSPDGRTHHPYKTVSPRWKETTADQASTSNSQVRGNRGPRRMLNDTTGVNSANSRLRKTLQDKQPAFLDK